MKQIKVGKFCSLGIVAILLMAMTTISYANSNDVKSAATFNTDSAVTPHILKPKMPKRPGVLLAVPQRLTQKQLDQLNRVNSEPNQARGRVNSRKTSNIKQRNTPRRSQKL